MPVSLTDKTIAITGASSGIGAATARACADAGMHVVLNARRADRLDDVAADIRACGREAIVVAGDVSEEATTQRILDAIPRLDVVFANAGYGISRETVDEEAADHRAIFDVNYFASVDLLRAAARQWVTNGHTGHLLMCSSCLSKFSLPRGGAYAATKAAQNAVCQSMRLELAERGIAVSSVHPITTTTEFFSASAQRSGRPDPGAATPGHAPGLFVQTPERVARAIVKCLRRPKPEVWTSHIVRTVAAVATAFPRFGDAVIARQSRKDERPLRR